MSLFNISGDQDSVFTGLSGKKVGMGFEALSEFYFFPAGSVSSNSNRVGEVFGKCENLSIGTENSEVFKVYSNLIEYNEYVSSQERFSDSARFQHRSLCSSPVINEDSNPKLSKTMQIPLLKLRSKRFYDFSANKSSASENSDEKKQLKTNCENYEKQNRVLRKEVHECNKEIIRLVDFTKKLQKKVEKYKENLQNKENILSVLSAAIKEYIDKELEIPVNEHSCNFILGKIQLQKSSMARKQSLYNKMKSTCTLLVAENKELKKSNEELSTKNTVLTKSLEHKKQKLKFFSEPQKIQSKLSGTLSSNPGSAAVSKSGTPVQEEEVFSNVRTKSRTLSAKVNLLGDIDSYREALRDLKYLSERANIKIVETRKVLGTLPKPSSKTIAKPVPNTNTAYRPSGYFNHNNKD